jgi:hypothetical protein
MKTLLSSLLIFAATTAAQGQTKAEPDSTTGSSIRWKGRKFETIYRTEAGGMYLARTRKGIYYRKFIKNEEQTTTN